MQQMTQGALDISGKALRSGTSVVTEPSHRQVSHSTPERAPQSPRECSARGAPSPGESLTRRPVELLFRLNRQLRSHNARIKKLLHGGRPILGNSRGNEIACPI